MHPMTEDCCKLCQGGYGAWLSDIKSKDEILKLQPRCEKLPSRPQFTLEARRMWSAAPIAQIFKAHAFTQSVSKGLDMILFVTHATKTHLVQAKAAQR